MTGQCPICEASGYTQVLTSTDTLYGTTTKPFHVVSCSRCGLLRLHPQPSAAELAGLYPPNYWFPGGGMAEKYRRMVLRDHVRFAERAIADSGAAGIVLDAGCGGGLFPALMRERGHRAVGLEFSEEAARAARRLKGVPVVRASLGEGSPVREGSCAAVTMFHVVEHLYDAKPYLDAAHAMLAPRGRLIVQVPNADCWQFALFGKNWNGIDIPRHLVNYRAKDLETLLARSGFEIVRRKHFSLRDNPAGLATSVAPRLDPMRRRVRGTKESRSKALVKDGLYFGLVVASLAPAALEALFGRGSTIMVEARKKA
jgi:SAM-dependent methyltransferase